MKVNKKVGGTRVQHDRLVKSAQGRESGKSNKSRKSGTSGMSRKSGKRQKVRKHRRTNGSSFKEAD